LSKRDGSVGSSAVVAVDEAVEDDDVAMCASS